LHRTPGNTGGKGREEELLSSFAFASANTNIKEEGDFMNPKKLDQIKKEYYQRIECLKRLNRIEPYCQKRHKVLAGFRDIYPQDIGWIDLRIKQPFLPYIFGKFKVILYQWHSFPYIPA
jgi:hypothetical protein